MLCPESMNNIIAWAVFRHFGKTVINFTDRRIYYNNNIVPTDRIV